MNMFRSLKFEAYKRLVYKFSKINRLSISSSYLSGQGIEIGAMDFPLPVRKGVKVKYLDRISKEDSAKIFPEIADKLVTVDIIGDGEDLGVVPDNSNDFIIGNHFLEHTQNPIHTIENMIRVVRKGGVIFIALPDKRFTFDEPREITSLNHLIQDYKQGPGWSEEAHYYDFVKNTVHGYGKSDFEILEVIKRLKSVNWSIHFHVWDHQAMIDMFCMLKKDMSFRFEIELALAAQPGGNESIFILRKI